MSVSSILHRSQVNEPHAFFIKVGTHAEVGLRVCNSAACCVNASSDLNRLLIPEGSGIFDQKLVFLKGPKIEQEHVVLI